MTREIEQEEDKRQDALIRKILASAGLLRETVK
jgi:hypothetical protein